MDSRAFFVKYILIYRLRLYTFVDMEKVVFTCKVDKSVKDKIIEQAKDQNLTPSEHGHAILKKHVSKQEGKETSKRETK